VDVRRYARGVLSLDNVLLPAPEAGVMLDARDLFATANLRLDCAHVELEIGCGKGGFLVRQATEHPERGYLGIEWANQIVRYAADRMVRRGLSNVRLIRTDARNFVVHHLAAASLQAMHVYHPDPWPKKRHHKRRLFQPDFVAAAIRALAPGARWAIQTDHLEYFEWIQRQLAPHVGGELRPVTFESTDSGVRPDATMGTNFEIKYLREGRAMYRLALQRTS
jgi:tRNA (guanine-N7-)-methyltransferase